MNRILQTEYIYSIAWMRALLYNPLAIGVLPTSYSEVRINAPLQSFQDALQQDAFPWVLLPYALIGFAMLTIKDAPSGPVAFLGLALLSLTAASWLLRRRFFRVAAWTLHLGALILVFFAWRWFPGSGAYHILILPVLGTSLVLGFAPSMIIAAIASGLLIYGMWFFVPVVTAGTIALATDLAVLWGVAFLVWVAQHPQKTMIGWAWQGYEQARLHLDEARDRQLELKQALSDLALATSQTIRLNELLSAARKAVEDARRAKEEFVANVSHELRTPLNMIIGFSDMILESPQVYSRRLPPALLADVAAIKRNSQHLANLVDDVLDLVEADTGRMQLLREQNSIYDVIQEAAETVAALFAKKGLTLTVDVSKDLPLIFCDRTRIRQVILNLLSNAGRFTEKGGALVRASIQNNMLTVSITDTGPGMAPDKLDRLFEPFQQADQSIRRRYGGSGLGLAISKRFVELHGGKIGLDSELGAGTTAWFSLPLHAELPPDGPERWFSPYQEYAPRTRQSRAPQIDLKSRVVVMEQGHALGHLIGHYLDNLEAIRATTPEEAIRAIQEDAAIALVINAASPSAVSEFMARTPKLPFDVPILSCWVPDRRSTVSAIGVQDYLVKPVRRDDLLDTIRRVAPQAHSVLLADDDPEARQLFARMLASAGQDFALLHASDGETALRLLSERQPDLLLLDWIMPDADGFSVLQTKSQNDLIRDIPVIVISAKDPEREPIVSKSLMVTRQEGLSTHDLMLSLESVTRALTPRFGGRAEPETPGA